MVKDIIEKNEQALAGRKELLVLKDFFPQCFTAEGYFDIEKFRASLPEGTNITDETTGFNFLGKNYARMLTNMDTTTLIRPDIEHNAKPENKDSHNVYISGDNLDALQHLVKSYAGRVKVIYIDPPYNTGSDGFVYKDKFTFSAEELAKRIDDDFGVETVLRTWLVADGYGLAEDAEEINLNDYTAYYKGNHLYLINPDDKFSAGSIAALMDKYNGEFFSPQNIVIFGYSFGFTHREELQKNLRTLKDGNKTLTVNIDVRY